MRGENESHVKSLLAEQQTLQERLTKTTFENSSMKEQLKAATEMVRQSPSTQLTLDTRDFVVV